MTTIINLTQHPASEDQKQAGVIDLEGKDLQELKQLLTFNSLIPHREMGEWNLIKEIWRRAEACAKIARKALGDNQGAALIGGAPFFMSSLEGALKEEGISPCFAVAIFRHEGFIFV